MSPKVNVVKKQRTAARARQTAATRRSIRKHAAIWNGTAARFEGFK